jgi:hypothetical protein
VVTANEVDPWSEGWGPLHNLHSFASRKNAHLPRHQQATMRKAILAIAVASIIASCGGTTTSTEAPPSAQAWPPHDDGGTDAPTDALVDVIDAPLPDAAPPTLDASPCLTGGSVWHLDQDFGANGTLGPVTYTSGEQFRFNATRSLPAMPSSIMVSIQGPTIESPDYDFDIGGAANSEGVPMGLLQVGTYTMADQFLFARPGDPSLEISGNGSACGSSTGTFEISELNITDAGQMTLTVAFSYLCDGSESPTLGCIHVENAPQGG